MRRAEQVRVKVSADGQVEIIAGYGPNPNRWEGESWQLLIRTAKTGPGLAEEVRLSSTSGFTPNELRRFGWEQWLRVADAAIRHYDSALQASPSGVDVMTRILWQRQPDPEGAARLATALREATDRQPRRPGSTGHPDEHYQRIAEAYLALLAQGERAPTKTLAETLGRNHYTVGGWLREARKRGLLPPVRQGKPG